MELEIISDLSDIEEFEKQIEQEKCEVEVLVTPVKQPDEEQKYDYKNQSYSLRRTKQRARRTFNLRSNTREEDKKKRNKAKLPVRRRLQLEEPGKIFNLVFQNSLIETTVLFSIPVENPFASLFFTSCSSDDAYDYNNILPSWEILVDELFSIDSLSEGE